MLYKGEFLKHMIGWVGWLHHMLLLRHKKNWKAKKLEAEGKAPPVKLDVDGALIKCFHGCPKGFKERRVELVTLPETNIASETLGLENEAFIFGPPCLVPCSCLGV